MKLRIVSVIFTMVFFISAISIPSALASSENLIMNGKRHRRNGYEYSFGKQYKEN